MDAVVHFEIPADDYKRASDFYTKTFGWKNQILGPEMGNYVLVTTINSNGTRPSEPGGINGGIYSREPGGEQQYPSIVIAVDDIQKSMGKVAQNGGKIHGEPYEITGIGHYVSIIDTEGNRVSLLQPFPLSNN